MYVRYLCKIDGAQCCTPSIFHVYVESEKGIFSDHVTKAYQLIMLILN